MVGRTFTFTEARRYLGQVLDAAKQDGVARIIRKGGEVFDVLPENNDAIPLATQTGLLMEQSGQQVLISFEQYPELAQATIGQILRSRLIGNHLLRFDDLDIDIDLRSIDHPEQFPLKFRP